MIYLSIEYKHWKLHGQKIMVLTVRCFNNIDVTKDA
jgi:hypothetical protein